MKSKPILIGDGKKAVTEIVIVPLGLFKHSFFEASEFEVEARLPLVIFLGGGIERRHETDDLGQGRCVNYGESNRRRNAKSKHLHAVLPSKSLLELTMRLKGR